MAYQSITLFGNLGNDPELRYTPSGVPVCSFSLAVNKRWTNASGELQEDTIWFRVTAWRKQAELISQYFAKGRKILVIGELEKPRVYTDRSGNPQASLDVTLRQFDFVESRDSGGDHGVGRAAAQVNAATRPAGAEPAGMADMLAEEDIPF